MEVGIWRRSSQLPCGDIGRAAKKTNSPVHRLFIPRACFESKLVRLGVSFSAPLCRRLRRQDSQQVRACPYRGHRARALASGSAITVEPENDKNPVIALREIAEKTISPGDMRERLIHSIQKQVEVDEPEAVAALAAQRDLRPTLGRDDPTNDAVVDTMTEEELLRGLERLSPEVPSSKSEGAPPGPRAF